MDFDDAYSLDGIDVSVHETADALTYTFAPRSAWRPGFPVASVLLFVVLPFGALGAIAYASEATRGNRPAWELAITATVAVQLVVWAALGGTFVWRGLTRWWYCSNRVALRFTATRVAHGDDPMVCAMTDLRGLRLFVYLGVPLAPSDLNLVPPDERPPGGSDAALSLVIGEKGHTHGLFGAVDATALRTLADDLHRRLQAFRHNQGLTPPLPPIEVIETTAEEAIRCQHTRPATGPGRRAAALLRVGALAFTHRGASMVWCVPMLAGLYASGRLVLAAGLAPWFLAGHVILGFLHAGFLCGAWSGFKLPSPQADAE